MSSLSRHSFEQMPHPPQHSSLFWLNLRIRFMVGAFLLRQFRAKHGTAAEQVTVTSRTISCLLR